MRTVTTGCRLLLLVAGPARGGGLVQCWFESVLTGWLVTCPGDANRDGAVGLTDFQGLVAAWGTGDPVYDIVPACGDGVVDI